MAPAFTSPSRLTFLAAALSLALLAGCATAGPGVTAANNGLLVFGARLGSAGTPDGLAGVPAEETPCLKGRDFSYEARDVLIGYGHDGRIRKVMTRNPGTSIYGIRPGDDFTSADAKVLAAGFQETGARHRYGNECCLLTLSVDSSGRVFNLLLELRDSTGAQWTNPWTPTNPLPGDREVTEGDPSSEHSPNAEQKYTDRELRAVFAGLCSG